MIKLLSTKMIIILSNMISKQKTIPNNSCGSISHNLRFEIPGVDWGFFAPLNLLEGEKLEELEQCTK
jgi:hypothetical protein